MGAEGFITGLSGHQSIAVRMFQCVSPAGVSHECHAEVDTLAILTSHGACYQGLREWHYPLQSRMKLSWEG